MFKVRNKHHARNSDVVCNRIAIELFAGIII